MNLSPYLLMSFEFFDQYLVCWPVCLLAYLYLCRFVSLSLFYGQFVWFLVITVLASYPLSRLTPCQTSFPGFVPFWAKTMFITSTDSYFSRVGSATLHMSSLYLNPDTSRPAISSEQSFYIPVPRSEIKETSLCDLMKTSWLQALESIKISRKNREIATIQSPTKLKLLYSLQCWASKPNKKTS